MTIKERVLEAARTSYAKNGLRQKELEKLSEVISNGLTDESSDEDVTTAVRNAEPYVTLIQSVGNRYATDAETKYKDYVSPKDLEDKYQLKVVEKTQDKQDKEPPKPLTLEDVQKLISESNKKAVEEALAPFKQQQETARLRTLLDNDPKLKAIPKEFRSRYSLEKEEDLDSVVSTIETEFASMKKAMLQSGEFVESPEKANFGGDTDDLIERMHKMAESSQTTDK